MEDELILDCPNCNCTLTVDNAGDLVIVEEPVLAANEAKGLGGLRVEHSGATPDDLKLFNQQHHKSRESLTDVPFLGNHPRMLTEEEELAAAKLIEANEKDLKKRAISPNTKTTK